jgi:lipoyl synthase
MVGAVGRVAGLSAPVRKPDWFRIRRLAVGDEASAVLQAVSRNRLNTVCSLAACPNKGACFADGTATFLILGGTCTRSCAFCNIPSGAPGPPDPAEPERVAEAAAEMGLRFVVVTSVTRDDLPDEGAGAFAATVRAIRIRLPSSRVEVLTPDFSGRQDLLASVLESGPDVFNHNVETVERLTPAIRSRALYARSLGLLRRAREMAPGTPTKSGLMVGLGEEPEELLRTFSDLASAGVERLTLGQYLQPSRHHHPVARYYSPEEFADLGERARAAGIRAVLAGPLVRSSYHAGRMADGPENPGDLP